VTLQGEGKFEITQSKYRLTEDQKQDEGQKLFDFCAECLKTFIDTNLAQDDGGFTLKEGETLPLGFTVSEVQLLLRLAVLILSFYSSRTRARKLGHIF
jgi:hexokinase